jgi:MFS family permease
MISRYSVLRQHAVTAYGGNLVIQQADRTQEQAERPSERQVGHAQTAEDGARSHVIARTRLTLRGHLGLSFLWFALNFLFAALLPIVIPAQILLFVSPGNAGNANQALFLGALAALGAGTTLVLQPIIGAISDRTPGRLGRRRPYIVMGAASVLSGLGLLCVARTIEMFIFALFLVVVGNTVCGTAYQGLVPDRVPAEQRGAASGYMGFMTILGTVGSLAVASLLLSLPGSSHALDSVARGAIIFYGMAGVILIVGVLVTLVAVREVPLTFAECWRRGECSPAERWARWQSRARHLWIDPWQHHNFTWVFLTRAFVMLGLALFMTFIAYYFAQVEHITNFVEATAFNAVLALGGAVFSAVILGILSDRMRRVPVVSVATFFMALTALTFVVTPGNIPLWPLGIIFGLGYGAYTSVDWALAIDALPSLKEAGKDMGIWSMASTLPGILGPLVGSMMVFLAGHFGATALGYRVVFGLACLSLLLGAVFVLKVRERPRSGQAASRLIDGKRAA